MTTLGSKPGKITAIALCLLLLVFMTAEAGHSHDHSQSQGHAACVWCSIAHVATVLAVDFSFGAQFLKGEVVAAQEPAGRQLFVIFLHRFRPPPMSQLEDAHI